MEGIEWRNQRLLWCEGWNNSKKQKLPQTNVTSPYIKTKNNLKFIFITFSSAANILSMKNHVRFRRSKAMQGIVRFIHIHCSTNFPLVNLNHYMYLYFTYLRHKAVHRENLSDSKNLIKLIQVSRQASKHTCMKWMMLMARLCGASWCAFCILLFFVCLTCWFWGWEGWNEKLCMYMCFSFVFYSF